MASTTKNLGLTVISEADDMPVKDFLQSLAGTADSSNMQLIDLAFGAIDPDGAVKEAGGIAAWILANYENADEGAY